MNTPILKTTKGKKTICFYNENDYEIWKKDNNDGKGWNSKYYKGLGTSTGKEFKEYFEDKKIMNLYLDVEDKDNMDLIFNKKKSNLRKEWLSKYERNNTLNMLNENVSIGDFIHKEMIHFSKI